MSAGCDRRWNCTRVLQHHAIDLCANQLAVLRTATEFHKRSFHVAAAVIWNSLPEHLRSPSTFKSQLRCGLTILLFQQAYSV